MGVDAEFIFDRQHDDTELDELESKINELLKGEIVEQATLIKDEGVEYDGDKIIVLLGLRYRVPGQPKCENDGTAIKLDRIGALLLDSGAKNLAYTMDCGGEIILYTRGMIQGK